MKPAELPGLLKQAWPHLQFVRKSGRTYNAECPECGSMGHVGNEWPDRFCMWDEGERSRGWCRRCNYMQFAVNIINSRNGKPPKINEEQLREWRRRTEEAWKKEEERRRKILAEFSTREIEEEYHRRLTDEHRQWWSRQGIPPSAQDYFNLGYTPEKRYEYNGGIYTSPAYTIPYHDLETKGLVNMQYRIVNPVAPGIRYRWHGGLGSSFFVSHPELGITDEVYVLEGAKKAMVFATHYLIDDRQVFAIPAMNDDAGLLPLLKDCGRVWIILDPGGEPWAHRHGAEIGYNARILTLPRKIDDAILSGMTLDTFRQLQEWAVVPRN